MVKIDLEFKNLIPPLTEEERNGLEESLLKEGCRDALVLWGDTIIDGHNRYEICTKHEIPFETVNREFESRNEVIEWIIKNQFGRRNLPMHERARQINDFRNLLYGSITPTDIDGCIEYQNKAYILIEIKYNDAQMPPGQELAFTRMCDDFTRVGKKAILILAEHYVGDCEKDVDVAMCIVRKYYFKFKWHDDFNGTVKNLTDRFIQSVNKSR